MCCGCQSASPTGFRVSPPSGHWDGSRLVVEVQVNFYGFAFDEFQKKQSKKVKTGSDETEGFTVSGLSCIYAT